MTAIRPAGPGVAVGLHALGIANGSNPEVLATVARRADEVGFATLWCGEHVVMVDGQGSRYPYSHDGKIAVPPDADWLDPLLTLSFAAACTARITLATGILLLPEHSPLLVAKHAATLDMLSRGRFALGVGVGWSAEEFAALGVPFDRRGAHGRVCRGHPGSLDPRCSHLRWRVHALRVGAGEPKAGARPEAAGDRRRHNGRSAPNLSSWPNRRPSLTRPRTGSPAWPRAGSIAESRPPHLQRSRMQGRR
jgi:hypothetical protein